jgi:transcriptional regulator with XRE-family HTH domain
MTNLKLARLQKGISQEKLGVMAGGIKQPRLSLIENGLRARADEIIALSAALGLPAEALFPGLDPDGYPEISLFATSCGQTPQL